MENPSQPPESEQETSQQKAPSLPPPTLLVLVVLLATIGTIKAFQSLRTDKTGSNALYFLGAAALVLVIDRLKGVEQTKEGGWRVEFYAAIKEEVKKGINSEVKPQLKEIGNLAASAAAAPSATVPAPGVAGPVPPSPALWRSNTPISPPTAGLRQETEVAAGLPPPTVADDPQKGRFGGKARSHGRCLTAFLDEAPPNARFYQVHLEVSRFDASTPALEGSVEFYLHDTIKPTVQRVAVQDGVARLSLLSFGAFTVGAIADGGATLLELDLAEDPRFPENFRNS